MMRDEIPPWTVLFGVRCRGVVVKVKSEVGRGFEVWEIRFTPRATWMGTEQTVWVSCCV
jgi:hypothetical protein